MNKEKQGLRNFIKFLSRKELISLKNIRKSIHIEILKNCSWAKNLNLSMSFTHLNLIQKIISKRDTKDKQRVGREKRKKKNKERIRKMNKVLI